MTKISAAAAKTIKTAFYGMASTTSSWAGNNSYFKNIKAAGRDITEYGYIQAVTDKYMTAQLIEGKRVHPTARGLFNLTLREFMEAVQTSIIHHQVFKAYSARYPVKSMENEWFRQLLSIEKYIDIYLGEVTDKEFQCRRRDIVVQVKEEYRDVISLSLKHTVLDKDLQETASSVTERKRREHFAY